MLCSHQATPWRLGNLRLRTTLRYAAPVLSRDWLDCQRGAEPESLPSCPGVGEVQKDTVPFRQQP